MDLHSFIPCNWMQLFYLEHVKTDRALGPVRERHCPRIQGWNDAQARQALGWVERNGGYDGDKVIYLNCIIIYTCGCFFQRIGDHNSLCEGLIIFHCQIEVEVYDVSEISTRGSQGINAAQVVSSFMAVNVIISFKFL